MGQISNILCNANKVIFSNHPCPSEDHPYPSEDHPYPSFGGVPAGRGGPEMPVY